MRDVIDAVAIASTVRDPTPTRVIATTLRSWSRQISDDVVNVAELRNEWMTVLDVVADILSDAA